MSARLEALDFLRGVAVLGIVAINVAGIGGPVIHTITPDWPRPAAPIDMVAFAIGLVVFEGKMRAVFSMLFGAGLVLFSRRAQARDRDGDALQVRRLFWLMAFGYAHYVLLWWGDILFVYACCGLVALMLSGLSDRRLLAIGVSLFVVWHVWGVLVDGPAAIAEQALHNAAATPLQAAYVDDWHARALEWMMHEEAQSHLGFLQHAGVRLSQAPLWPLQMLGAVFGETLPLMLIGMVAYRRGVLRWATTPAGLRAGLALTLCGLVPTVIFTLWAFDARFPPLAMQLALSSGLAPVHLVMGSGYALVLLHLAPAAVRRRAGSAFVFAGRCAFSNYIGASLLLTPVFQGWGLGLFGRIGAAAQWGIVFAMWAMMLIWSRWWLIRWRRGPLEWLWRSLVERRWLANRLHRNELFTD